MKKNDMCMIVCSEDDLEVLTRTLFKHNKRCYVITQRYDIINVEYIVVMDVLKTSEIKRILNDYRKIGGFEEPEIKFR